MAHDSHPEFFRTEIVKFIIASFCNFFSVVQLFPRNQIHFYFYRYKVCLLEIVACFQKFIAPATYTILKCISISTLKRVKTSTFFTMTNSRINHLLMIPIYIDKLDEINLILIKKAY